MQNVFTVRRIVITGVLAAIAILLGVTRLGFIPVPNVSGSATIMHVPAIIGGVLEGPVVGLLVGGIFGIYSWLQDTTGLFKNPVVSVLPRLLIGVTAYYSYAMLKKTNEYLALIVAGVVGTLTNTILVVGALVGFAHPSGGGAHHHSASRGRSRHRRYHHRGRRRRVEAHRRWARQVVRVTLIFVIARARSARSNR